MPARPRLPIGTANAIGKGPVYEIVNPACTQNNAPWGICEVDQCGSNACRAVGAVRGVSGWKEADI